MSRLSKMVVGRQGMRVALALVPVLLQGWRYFRQLRQPVLREQVPLLAYDETVRYFVEQRPADERIVQGALFLQHTSTGMSTMWAFLDGDGQLVNDTAGNPYGRYLLVKALDEELQDLFAETELLIFA